MSLSLFPSPPRTQRPGSFASGPQYGVSRKSSTNRLAENRLSSRPAGYSVSPTRASQYQQLLSPFPHGNDPVCESPVAFSPITNDASSPSVQTSGQNSMDSIGSPIQFPVMLEGSNIAPLLLRQASNETRRPRAARNLKPSSSRLSSKQLMPTLDPIPASRSPSPSFPNFSRSLSPLALNIDIPKPLRTSAALRQSTVVQLSPAALKTLGSDVPTVNVLPSLDGSQHSDQHGTSDTPPTPVVGLTTSELADWHSEPLPLDFAALQTLQALPDQDTISPVGVPDARSLPPLNTQLQPSLAAPIELDESELDDVQSSLAENFYKRPWEDSVENETFQKTWDFYRHLAPSVPTPAAEATNSRPRPRPYPFRQDSLAAEESAAKEAAPLPVERPSTAESAHANRTSMWLKQQTNLLSSLRTPSPQTAPPSLTSTPGPVPSTRPTTTSPGPILRAATTSPGQESSSSPHGQKKSVRFSNDVRTTVLPEQSIDLETITVARESALYRAFQQLTRSARRRDAFIQGLARSDSVHTERLTRKTSHITKLSVESARFSHSLPKAGSPISKADAERFEQRDLEEAIEQLNPMRWEVEAQNFIQKRELLISPSGAHLRKLSHESQQKQAILPKAGTATTPAKRAKPRVLDLGGEACGWGWHCAEALPHVNVYTVVPLSPISATFTTSAGSPVPKPKGPPNHRLVHVTSLTHLPFGDNKFDVISGRSLHSILKLRATAVADGQVLMDEWDACLNECMRVLRPGGHLEWNLMDAGICNSGPQGRGMSERFAALAASRGWDPSPCGAFGGRLRRSGFKGVRRCWMVLPAAQFIAEDEEGLRSPVVSPKMLGEGVAAAAAVQEGGIRGTSQLTGLVGGRSWERWLLRVEREDGSGEGRRLMEGFSGMLEEAAVLGGGYRFMTGYARKPRRESR